MNVRAILINDWTVEENGSGTVCIYFFCAIRIYIYIYIYIYIFEWDISENGYR
jgi:hypothetical protein